MSVLERVISSVDACRKDLTLVSDGLKWALEPGLTPGGRGLDAPRGKALTARDAERCRHCRQQIWPETDAWVTLDDDAVCPKSLARVHDPDPDALPGAARALDIGDPILRRAFVEGVRLLSIAELRLVLAVYALGTAAAQPKPVQPQPMSTFVIIDICRMGMERRLTIIERDMRLVGAPQLRTIGRHLHGPIDREHDAVPARDALDRAVRKLSKALDRGDVSALWDGDPSRADPTATIPKDRLCVWCGRRKKHKKWSPRCSPCGHWIKRHGVERPKHLDSILPHEAAAKRRDRGEGWGMG